MELINKRLINLINAIEIEKQFELDEFNFSLNSITIAERVIEGKTMYPLNYLGVSFTKFGESLFEFELTEKINASKFSNGSLVELFNSDNESEKGIVYYQTINKLSIKSNSDEIQNWITKGKVGLNLLPDTKTFDLYLDRLKSIKDTSFETNILNLYSKVHIQNKGLNKFKNSRLNESQTQCVNSIIDPDNLTTIIHGPPGTGKTTTIVATVLELIKQNKKVVICAPTNAAVDNVALKLIDGNVDICRIGNPLKIESELVKYTLDGKVINDSSFKIVEQLKKQEHKLRKQAFKYKRNFGKEEFIERKRLKNDLRTLRKDIRKLQKDIYKNILIDSKVVLGTFIGVLSKDLSKCEFDYLIVDEAAQAIEPAIWSVSHLAQKLVLAGDNFQLPPFVQSKKAIELGLNISILEMAHKNNYPTHLLDEQYRMNQKIMNFSNSYFYESKLKAAPLVKEWVIDEDNFEAIEFIDTAGCDFEEELLENTKALKNNGESGVILNRLKTLNLEVYSVGIISPYRAQVQYLQSLLLKSKIDINTIDSFQGQERDIILLSLVRSNTESNIGFLNDYRRMNVAMTRAKKKLIVIGDSATIGNDPFYGDLLNYIEQFGSYRSAWEFM